MPSIKCEARSMPAESIAQLGGSARCRHTACHSLGSPAGALQAGMRGALIFEQTEAVKGCVRAVLSQLQAALLEHGGAPPPSHL